MSDLKTKPTKENPEDFLNTIENEQKRKDAFTILKLLKKVTRKPAIMWGTSIIGFGTYHYKYASGREGDWPRIGFSPRKTSLTIYIMSGVKNYPDHLKKLGNPKTGSSCLYLKSLKDVDLKILEDLMKQSLKKMKEMYPK